MRALGLSLMSFSLLLCAGIAFWVYRYSSHHVLKASQPFSLYLVLFGSAIQSLVVLPISFDEGAGWSTSQLTKLCNMLPWCFAAGYVIVLGALYVKLWRVHQTLQFSRRRINLSHIAVPSLVLVASALVILIIQVSIAPLEWVREVVDDLTGDSQGQCESSTDKFAFWVVPLACVVIAMMFLLGFAAYKTRDVDSAYSESSWIVVMMVTHIEVMLIGVPLIITFKSLDSKKDSYLIFVFLALVFPDSTLGFIFVPKMYALWLALTGQDKQRKRGQRSSQHVRVTGLGPPPNTAVSSRVTADASAPAILPEEAPNESVVECDEAHSAASPEEPGVPDEGPVEASTDLPEASADGDAVDAATNLPEATADEDAVDAETNLPEAVLEENPVEASATLPEEEGTELEQNNDAKP